MPDSSQGRREDALEGQVAVSEAGRAGSGYRLGPTGPWASCQSLADLDIKEMSGESGTARAGGPSQELYGEE